MKTENIISLELSGQNVFCITVGKQYDSKSRVLRVRLTDRGNPVLLGADTIATVHFKRADGQSNTYLAQRQEDGTLMISLPAWVLALSGLGTGEICLVSADESRLSTSTFTILVEKSICKGEEIAQDENYDVLVSLLAEVATYRLAENDRVTAESARVANENERQSKTAQALADCRAATENAEEIVKQDQTAATEAQQALRDLLAMMGADIATLVGGKIPASQIPALATTEVYSADSQAQMEALSVERGDICIRTDENKSYIYNENGWIYLAAPTDYAAQAGHAQIADNADNAAKINGHRLVQMREADFESAVKDQETYYLVWEE